MENYNNSENKKKSDDFTLKSFFYLINTLTV